MKDDPEITLLDGEKTENPAEASEEKEERWEKEEGILVTENIRDRIRKINTTNDI